MADTNVSNFSPSTLDSVIIRTVQQGDLPALEWEGEYAHFRRLYAEAFQRSRRGLNVLWLAEQPGLGVLGQVFIQLNCDRPEMCNGIDRAYLYAFRVRPAFRSMGLGARMLRVAEDDLLEREYRYLTLNVARVNVRAQTFYRRHGFSVVAPEPGRWSYVDHEGRLRNIVEPAWRMEKRLLRD
jgi:ribosomal protein S18 acetylase RimI-like enzyme